MDKTLNKQMKEKANKPSQRRRKKEQLITTGSTLLDLAIARDLKEGCLPGGILIEIFGDSSLGKTSLLCEIAGAVQRHGGKIMFQDPEARLSTQYAKLFGVDLKDSDVQYPNTPIEVFENVRSFSPKDSNKINGIFLDSTAALASDLEMENKKDEYSRRAKLFSQELRKTCRILAASNYLMVCTNQIRDKVDVSFGEKTEPPGGRAFKFYSSLRLKITPQQFTKIYKTTKVNSKEVKKVVGIAVNVEVYKSSVGVPYEKVPLYFIFNYGIDDIRANLQYVKDYSSHSVYTVNDKNLDKSLDKSIQMVEDSGLEEDLKQNTYKIWKDIQSKFDIYRKLKKR